MIFPTIDPLGSVRMRNEYIPHYNITSDRPINERTERNERSEIHVVWDI